jgi:hypothetical protein
VLRQVDSLFASLVSHGGADLDHSAILLELRRINKSETLLPKR